MLTHSCSMAMMSSESNHVETLGHLELLIDDMQAIEQAASMLDLVSQRDRAQATAARLRERISDLFGPEAARLDALASQPSIKGSS